MGAGTIIATAIVIVLLIVTGYVLIGGTLSTARIVALAQQAATEQETQRIHTRIEIVRAVTNATDGLTFILVNNTGSEVIGHFDHVEVFLLQGGAPYTYLNQSSGPWNWTYTITPDLVHPGLLDPDEVANLTVPYDPDPLKGPPEWVKVTTANGVYDSAYAIIE
ncbi:MAG: flagellin [Methanomicrobiales archaeon]|nr:flagellin [Methanomicrobiales archaeon]MDD1669889.1 flagellin [Methanomicrobiales archaeon]